MQGRPFTVHYVSGYVRMQHLHDTYWYVFNHFDETVVEARACQQRLCQQVGGVSLAQPHPTLDCEKDVAGGAAVLPYPGRILADGVDFV